MPGWMPGATIRHGANSGYARGRNAFGTTVCHYTVGRDSTSVGDRGYFNFLCRRNGEIVQFAEADSVTWHAGNWNSRGPGIEIEFLESYDGPAPENIFTPAQLAAAGEVCRWLIANGMPNRFYDGGRISDWSGFITHRSLIQTGDWHTDYWTAAQFARAVGGAAAPPPPPPKNPGVKGMLLKDQDSDTIWLVGPSTLHAVPSMDEFNQLKFVGVPYAGAANSLTIVGWAVKFGWQEGMPIT